MESWEDKAISRSVFDIRSIVETGRIEIEDKENMSELNQKLEETLVGILNRIQSAVNSGDVEKVDTLTRAYQRLLRNNGKRNKK